jgi:tetratricopeptide (TPR) repeat protein
MRIIKKIQLVLFLLVIILYAATQADVKHATKPYSEENNEQALTLAKKDLEVAEKKKGPDHPDVAISLNDLALIYDSQGQYSKAEPLYKRSLTISEKALGPDHPEVATSLENLAKLLRNTNRKNEAKDLEARAERIRAARE